ncbi:MAG: hypothetical protein A2204_01835 [Elusimicrobia bacterium RIFOXYA1_FULL_47_7]|nr:MAG: hypothetical protein A2278_01530 [Elusimicrobia bacterium RIFOXYA12_FULL_49_49]OGS06118.1 MAG: hypothetical protein A2204_01835 [Elusimicrobia bacterium RIFOXYA1_FULL_47_7]OGS10788.1 MAG: hypothetical protein A2386_06145 [Elusimicrobia bacterium RIFOXYB1_FULL_48_9]OGS16906.1 MAG: hypothetical protein A2251_04980 [Elusimicrobia bacterium RIFOXYA2_FULL_47_53]OGS27046.1 MAG: hypothetical protein A2339_04835 [Elusimicrobia bacterium RIFOXYB12_FULL_50_12]OGS32134.1 MAG: hypothetical protein
MSKLKIVKKPWGREIWFAHTPAYAAKILIVKKGCRLSLQYHRNKMETLFIDKGILKVSTGKVGGKLKTKTVKAGFVLHLPPKTVHRTHAIKECRIIEVSTPQLTDIVRIQDDYNRIK